MEPKNLTKAQLSEIREMNRWQCKVIYQPMILGDDDDPVVNPTYEVECPTIQEAIDRMWSEHPNAKQINCTRA